jgi:vacuolar protein sorting-associated protein 72
VFDADFDDDESSSDSEEVAVARERRRPALKAPERKAPPAQTAARAPPRPKAVKPDPSDVANDAYAFGGATRTSKRSGVQAILKRSEEAREAAKAKPGPRRPSNVEPPRQLTQAEILAEAAATEIANLADLERLLSAEAAVLKKAERAKKSDAFLPTVRARSFRDSNTGEAVVRLELRHGAQMPPPLCDKIPVKKKEPPRCVVSGEKARYKDPATGVPFFDAAAFKELRRRRDDGELFQGTAIIPSIEVDQTRTLNRGEPDGHARPNAPSALPGKSVFPGTPVHDLGALGAPSGSSERVSAPNPAKRAKKTVSLNDV